MLGSERLGPQAKNPVKRKLFGLCGNLPSIPTPQPFKGHNSHPLLFFAEQRWYWRSCFKQNLPVFLHGTLIGCSSTLCLLSLSTNSPHGTSMACTDFEAGMKHLDAFTFQDLESCISPNLIHPTHAELSVLFVTSSGTWRYFEKSVCGVQYSQAWYL